MLFTILYRGKPLCALFAADEDEAVDAFIRDLHCSEDARPQLRAEPARW